MNKLNNLVDGYGRRLTYLRISVTDRCNLRCVYCMPESGVSIMKHEDIISYEDILRLVRILSRHGLNKVRITGGEPLARKGLIGFVQKLSEIKDISDISMTTNGILFDKYAHGLFDAGLKRINISLDSLNEEKFKRITRTGRLETVLKNIELAKKIGYNPIKINTVLIRGINDDEIIDFVNFARKFELNLRFIEYMPIGGNIADAVSSREIEEKIQLEFDDFKPKKSKIKYNNVSGENVYEKKLSVYDGVSRIFGFDGNDAVIGFISPMSEHFCGGCNRLRLTASGNLRLCLFYDDEYNIKDILKESDDEIVFEKISNIVKLKHFKHNFNEKTEKKGDISWANDFMNSIGG
ncbi:MAG: GTP 3',8-cyclase MoaA [Deltaproteobacteria bacterium]|jgi:cyclic pyranopterin phosphate synthase|nr:GTP 3',8-cyclase MoaA [Deltaproteobacteria bacterium]